MKKWNNLNSEKANYGNIHLRIVASLLAIETFSEGETGASPKNTSKRAKVTFVDSILASTPDGIPFDDTQTWKSQHNSQNYYVEGRTKGKKPELKYKSCKLCCHRKHELEVCFWIPTKFTLTSILEGSSQVKNMKVPFLRARPWKMLRNVDRADSSTGVGAWILGEIASSKASQKVLPSTSLTKTICNDFSKGAALKESYIRKII